MQLLIIVTAMLAAIPALAHEGHEHAPEPRLTQPIAPRLSASTAEVELIGILQPPRLRLYLDRFASNEPILNARLELESGRRKATAVAQTDGSYLIDAPWLTQGEHDLVFSVEAGPLTDLLPLKFKLATAPAKPTPASNNRHLFIWTGIAALSLILGPLAALRIRGQRAGAGK